MNTIGRSVTAPAVFSFRGVVYMDQGQKQRIISEIIVPKPNILLFRFSDGTEHTVSWQDRSRSESWTPEMKAKAAERSRKRGKK